MSIDRAKALKAAEKHLRNGQIDRAIVEFEKLTSNNSSDARSLLRLGDLYSRQGNHKEAAATYRKVAQQYAQQGIFLKAVAVYKQILKLEPSDLEASEGLGEMYEMLSLPSDALAIYERVADAYMDAGKPEKALKALGKVAQFDPENVAAWVRYAEALSKANKIDEAVTAFQRGADLLEKQGRLDDYIKVTERLLFHSHDDLDRARKLAAIYIKRDQAKAALAHLQTCFKANPKDPATLELLARAFQALGQGPKAVSVYKEMARIHGDAGRSPEEASALHRLLEVDPGDREAKQRLSALSAAGVNPDDSTQIVLDDEVDEVVIVDDEPSISSASQPSIKPLGSEERAAQITRLMAECEVFLRYGLRDKVVAQLNRVLDLDPNHIEAREKLRDAHLKRGEVGSAVTQLLLLSEAVAQSDPGRAGGYLEQAANLSPQNEAVVERLRELRGTAGAVAAARAAAANADDDEDEMIVLAEDVYDDETDFSDLRSHPPPKVGPREVSLATALEGAEEPELTLEQPDDEEPELLFESARPDAPVEHELFQDSVPPPPSALRSPLVQVVADARDAPEAELDEALADVFEEVGFYLTQGLTDEAREVLTDALGEHPDHPQLLAKLAELDAEQAPNPGAAAAQRDAEDHSFALAQKLADEASGSSPQGPIEVSELLQQFKEGVQRQVAKSDTATHYDLGIAYMEMGLHLEAIEEFRLCLDRPEKQCTAHTMIGLSYVAKGDMEPALMHFKLALDGPVRTAEEELGLWFEVGNASELLGRASEALIWYEKVEERDPGFRDVGLRIERLGVKKSVQQEGDEFDAMFDSIVLKD